MKTVVAFLVAFAGGAAFAAHAAPAPKQNCGLDLYADKVDASVTNGKGGTATGNVVVTQCDMKMRADAVNVTMANGQYDRIIAKGKIVLISEKSGVVTADDGVYDVAKRLVTLTGRVVLKNGANVLSGTRGTYNLATGVAMVDAPSGAPGGGNGRVHAILTPPPAKEGAQ